MAAVRVREHRLARHRGPRHDGVRDADRPARGRRSDLRPGLRRRGDALGERASPDTPSGTLRTSDAAPARSERRVPDRDDRPRASTGPGGLPIATRERSRSGRAPTSLLRSPRDRRPREPRRGPLYRIDPATRRRHAVFANNSTKLQESAIAFAPDGTLYQSLANSCTLAVRRQPRSSRPLDLVTGRRPDDRADCAIFFKALAFRADGVPSSRPLPRTCTRRPTSTTCSPHRARHRRAPLRSAYTGHNPIGALAFGRGRRRAQTDCFQLEISRSVAPAADRSGSARSRSPVSLKRSSPRNPAGTDATIAAPCRWRRSSVRTSRS